MANINWGATCEVLFQLDRAFVRSKLDYGSMVYGSARPSYLKELNSVHNQGLRIRLGAYRASPINSLLVEANEYTLTDMRLKLSLQYAVKLYSTPKIQLSLLFLDLVSGTCMLISHRLSSLLVYVLSLIWKMLILTLV